MIFIQVVLIAAFLALVLRMLMNPNSHQMKAGQKVLGISFFSLAIVAVLSPDTLNWVANKLGVGRGADLLLYILTLAFIFFVLHQYIKEKQDQRRFVELSRKVAIIAAAQEERNKKLIPRAGK